MAVVVMVIGSLAWVELVPPDICVVYSRLTPGFRPDCPFSKCAFVAVEDTLLSLPSAQRYRTVIVSGHGDGFNYLGLPARRIAQVVASYGPELVVVDSCYSASYPLLNAFAEVGLKAQVVATNHRIKANSLLYRPAFFEAGAVQTRSHAVESPFGRELTRGVVTRQGLDEARLGVHAMNLSELEKRLVRIAPNLVLEQVDGLIGGVLFEVSQERFKGER